MPGGAASVGRHLVGHEAPHERDELRLRGNLVDELVASEIAEVRERRMTGVEQPQLHRLERRDIVDERGAGHFPRGRPAANRSSITHCANGS